MSVSRPSGKRAQGFADLRRPACVPQGLVRDRLPGLRRLPQTEIGAHGIAEDQGVLLNESEPPPDGSVGVVAKAASPDHDRAGLRIVETSQQGDDGGLADAAATDDGHALARIDLKGDVFEHGNVGAVSEPHAIESDGAWTALEGTSSVALRGQLDDAPDPVHAHGVQAHSEQHAAELGDLAEGGREVGGKGDVTAEREPVGKHERAGHEKESDLQHECHELTDPVGRELHDRRAHLEGLSTLGAAPQASVPPYWWRRAVGCRQHPE